MIKIAELNLGYEEINAVVEVLKSGKLREGEKCKEFEIAFADMIGAKYATTMSNGTTALHTAYMNLFEPDSEVLVPSFTFFATASMIVWAKGFPVFCDIDPKTFCIDLNDVEKKISSKTSAIAPVHLFGNSCDIDGILYLAEKYNLKVIWDAAQAHLTKFKGRDVGSYDDAACYSFYATKNMTTGEGGMITSNNKRFIERCILFKHQGQKRKYYHTTMGTNYRMNDIQAAIGLQQLKQIKDNTIKRRENAQRLDEGLRDIDGIITPYVPPEVQHCYHQYTILLNEKIDRKSFIQELVTREINCVVNYPMPLHLQPVFEKYVKNERIPNAEKIAERCLSLPIQPYLGDNEMQIIIEAIKEIVDRY